MASMEEAFDMVETLTQELVDKEEIIIKLEEEKKDLFMEKEIYFDLGFRIYENKDDELSHFEDEYIHNIDVDYPFKWKMKAVELYMNAPTNHEFYYPYNYENVIKTESDILAQLKEDYDLLDEDDEDKRYYKYVLEEDDDGIVEDFTNYTDTFGIDWCCQLPWKKITPENHENLYVIMWRL